MSQPRSFCVICISFAYFCICLSNGFWAGQPGSHEVCMHQLSAKNMKRAQLGRVVVGSAKVTHVTIVARGLVWQATVSAIVYEIN